jgi:isopentenyl-diphosphate Delta-isomerase
LSYNFSKIFRRGRIAAIGGITLLLVASAYFMTAVAMPAEARWVSVVNVVLFAIPAFWAARRWLGLRDAVILFVIMGAYALAVETIALVTDVPYGSFYYSDLLGYKLFGITPITVSLAWTPLVIASYAVAKRIVGNAFATVIIGTLVLAAFDLVVDPGAVRIGFWRYEGGGPYYGVPLSNYIGWLITGIVAMTIIELFLHLRKPLLPEPVQLISSAFFITVLWTAVAVFGGMLWPSVFGVALIVGLAAFYVRYYYAFDDMIVYVDESGRAIGTAPKLAAHTDDTQLHSAFSVFLFDKKGRLLLQQRALSKKTWPGTWSNSCCGHVMLHENVMDAAKRRLAYELGIKAERLKVMLPDYRYRAEKDGVVENEICPVLVGFSGSDPRPNADEVADTRWLDWETFVTDVSNPENGYSPWAIEETALLAASPAFAELRRRFVVEST